jgi:UDP-glucose 4-epimerase
MKKPLAKDKSIVIIGVNGFIGRSLLRHLEKDTRYKRVIAIDYKKPNLTLKKTKFYKLNLTETMADVTLSEILTDEACDTLVLTAFPMSPPKDQALAHEVIAIGSFYVMNACAAAQVRKVVMASITDVYGAFPTNPNYLTEDMPPKGHLQDRFLADRIDAEKQALKYAAKFPDRLVTILRHATILGPTIESYKTRYLRRTISTTMLGFDPLTQFIHEDDVISAFIKAIDEDHKGIFNLAADGVLPLSRVIKLCGKLHIPLTQIGFKTGVQLLWLMDLSPAPASHVDFLRYLCVADNDKLKNIFGFTPRYTSKEALLTFIGAERLRELDLTETAA